MPGPLFQVTCQINVLAYNAVSGTTHRDGNGRPRGIPRIRNRIILPSLCFVSMKVDIKPTDNVDFVVATIIRCGREIATAASGIGAPVVQVLVRDVVDLDDIAWAMKVASKPPKT